MNCMIEGCSRTHMARGYCEMHYSRQRRNGDPLRLMRSPNGTRKPKNVELLTLERLKSLLEYDPGSGLFKRLVPVSNLPAGSIAGGYDIKGYVIIHIDGRSYKAHRLAVFYMNGRWPDEDVDHASGVKPDNRWTNIRCASRSQNNANRSLTSDLSSSGLKGVHWHGGAGKWRARLANRHLGLFDSKRDAQAAYLSAAKEEFGEFARPA